jgi:hypothetical protein
MSPKKRTTSLLLGVTEYKYKILHSVWFAGLAQNIFFRVHLSGSATNSQLYRGSNFIPAS